MSTRERGGGVVDMDKRKKEKRGERGKKKEKKKRCGHLVKLSFPRLAHLTGTFDPRVGRFECVE